MSARRDLRALTAPEEDAIIDLLADGLGVEDIAMPCRLNLPVALVRAFVFSMAPDLRREIYRSDGEQK